MKKKSIFPQTKVKNPEPKNTSSEWIIWAAWADRITFEEIYEKTGKTEHMELWPKTWSVVFLSGFIGCQLLIPFRHHLNPGETNWHEEGHYFSWRMMLRQKVVEIRYDITHPDTGETRYAPLEDYLNPSQIRSFSGNPGMNLQFAHHLKNLVEANAGFSPRITAKIQVSLNGREKKRLVDDDLDLKKIENFSPAFNWVQRF